VNTQSQLLQRLYERATLFLLSHAIMVVSPVLTTTSQSNQNGQTSTDKHLNHLTDYDNPKFVPNGRNGASGVIREL